MHRPTAGRSRAGRVLARSAPAGPQPLSRQLAAGQLLADQYRMAGPLARGLHEMVGPLAADAWAVTLAAGGRHAEARARRALAAA